MQKYIRDLSVVKHICMRKSNIVNLDKCEALSIDLSQYATSKENTKIHLGCLKFFCN